MDILVNMLTVALEEPDRDAAFQTLQKAAEQYKINLKQAW